VLVALATAVKITLRGGYHLPLFHLPLAGRIDPDIVPADWLSCENFLEETAMNGNRPRTLAICCGFLLFALGLCGCMEQKKAHYRNSLIDYLYPNVQAPQEEPVAPAAVDITLPAKVGIAFAPDQVALLSEKDKLELLQRIKAEFTRYPQFSAVEVIPSQHLSMGGGFANLDQLRLMYGIDLAALISYDQMQHTDQGFKSISYWTIVGMYVIEGEKNDTNTMMDISLFHIPSRKMLLHAAGTSQVKESATIINLSEQLRSDSLSGFSQATDNMINNLREELGKLQSSDAPR
jgi:rhombotail lipoprotein